MLFKLVELPSAEPVQFVGVYVLNWGCAEKPTVAFREATPEEIAAESQFATRILPNPEVKEYRAAVASLAQKFENLRQTTEDTLAACARQTRAPESLRGGRLRRPTWSDPD